MSIETATSDVVFGAIASKFSASIVHPSAAVLADTATTAGSCSDAISADYVSIVMTAGSYLPSGSSAAWAGYAESAGAHVMTHTSGGKTVSHGPAGYASTVELYASEAGEVGSALYVPNGSASEGGTVIYYSADYAVSAGSVSSAGTVGSALQIPRYKVVDGSNVPISADMAGSASICMSALAVNSARYVPSAYYDAGGAYVHPIVPFAASAGKVSSAAAVGSAGYVVSSARIDGSTVKPVVPHAGIAGRASRCASAVKCSKAVRIDSSFAASAGSAAVAGPGCVDPVIAALTPTTLDTAWPQTVSGAKTFTDGIVVPETQDGSFIVPFSQVSAVISAALEAYASAHGL